MNRMTDERAEAARALKGPSETLLIPLAARALARTRHPLLGFRDQAAERLARELNVDLSRYARSAQTVRGCIVRSQWFDKVASRFIAENAHPCVLSLGSGLNTMYERVAGLAGGKPFRWIDSDLGDVVALRRALFADDPQRTTLTLDLNDPAMMERVALRPDESLLVVAEGLLMYLPTATVERLFRELPDRALTARPLCVAFDWPSPMMARNGRRHPAVGRTRDKSVTFDWSLKRPEDITRLDPMWRIIESFDVAARSGPATATMQFIHRVVTQGRWIYGCTLVRQR